MQRSDRMTRTLVLVLAALAILAAPAAAVAAGTPGSRSEIVVKVDLGDGYTIDNVAAGLPIEVQSAVLASRGIYLVRSTSDQYTDDPGKTNELAQKIRARTGVVYAEPDITTTVADTRFHSWPEGDPLDLGDDDAAAVYDQPAADELQLAAAHDRATGAGVTVAVLDTGVDASHPALAGRMLPGWNYVDDDADASDVADAEGSSAVGHGTFVAGLVALVAPDARILPLRVLDGDGDGDIFTLAEAIDDAVADGADVINLSLGTAYRYRSNVLSDAIRAARHAGVVVVAATGNDGTKAPHFPAQQPEVLSVSALDPSDTALASFSVWGGWVDVAAPGEDVVGPLPGGRYAVWAGTSVAAPFAAGEAALLRSALPGLSAAKLMTAICTSAQHLADKRVHFGAIDVLGALGFAAAHP
jgi:subtilisin family serine protease